jgi:hypothetical protein
MDQAGNLPVLIGNAALANRSLLRKVPFAELRIAGLAEGDCAPIWGFHVGRDRLRLLAKLLDGAKKVGSI